MYSYKVNDDIELKPLQDNHAKELFDLIDRNRAHIAKFLPWERRTQTWQDSLAFIKAQRKMCAENGTIDCGIFYKGALAGKVSLHEIDWPNRRSSLGYWLSKDMTGRGIMTQCVTAVLDYAFTELGLNHIHLKAAPENKASCAIAERLGFKHEGTLRDDLWNHDHFLDMNFYGMRAIEWEKLKSEWKNKREEKTHP